jgi:hypothetical protein
MKLYNQLKSEIIKNWQEMKKDRSLMLKNLSKGLFLFSAIAFIFNFGYFIFFLFSGLAINEKAKKFIIEKLNKKNFSNKKYIGIMLSIAFLGFIFSGDSDDANKNITKEANKNITKEKATASSSAKKQKTTESSKKYSENYQYQSGKVDSAIYCGNNSDGFEIFLTDGFEFKILTFTRKNPAKLGMDSNTIASLIVPIRDGKPSYDGISVHPLSKEPEYYDLDGYPFGRYLNWVDHNIGGDDGMKIAPDYYLYRDGSQLRSFINKEKLNSDFQLPHADSLGTEENPYGAKPCNPLSEVSPQVLIEKRLVGFSKFMKNKYDKITAEIKAKEDAAKF